MTTLDFIPAGTELCLVRGDSVDGYCPCQRPEGHDGTHRCTHGHTWGTP